LQPIKPDQPDPGGAPDGPPALPFLQQYSDRPPPGGSQDFLDGVTWGGSSGPSVTMEMDIDGVLRAVKKYEDQLAEMRPMLREARVVGTVEPPGEEDASHGFVRANREPADS
jgi:hypothetical protein